MIIPSRLAHLLYWLCCGFFLLACQSEPPVATTSDFAIVVADNTPFLQDIQTKNPLEPLAMGTVLVVLQPFVQTDNDGRIYLQVQTTDENPRTGYVLQTQVVINGYMAVVTQAQAICYTQPHTSATSTDRLPWLALVAINPALSTNDFAQFVYIDAQGNQPFGRDSYIQTTAISPYSVDITAAHAYQQALQATDIAQQKQWLQLAQKSGSKLLTSLIEAWYKNITNDWQNELAKGELLTMFPVKTIRLARKTPYYLAANDTTHLMGYIDAKQSITLLYYKPQSSNSIQETWFFAKNIGWVFGRDLSTQTKERLI